MLMGSFLVLLLLVPAPALSTQVAAQGSKSETSVPQICDWHQDRAIPSTTPWGQTVDVEATQLVLSWAKEEEFTNPLVDHLPLQEGVISPMAHFGYPMVKPGILHTSGEFYAWHEALSASSHGVRWGT